MVNKSPLIISLPCSSYAAIFSIHASAATPQWVLSGDEWNLFDKCQCFTQRDALGAITPGLVAA
jgi:hypothetical protein